MTVEEQGKMLLGNLDSQVGPCTDFLLKRDPAGGNCGHASCVHVSVDGREFSVSCQHVLRPNLLYYTGPTQLKIDQITDEDMRKPAVPPLQLVAECAMLDLALFKHPGLDLAKISKRSFVLGPDTLTFERASWNKGSLGFIWGTPGFAARMAEYTDGAVYVNTPVYKAYGPIVTVEVDRITADFAETKLIELKNAAGSPIEGIQATRGARDLSGMSGSGLWVRWDSNFHLAGILRAREKGSDTIASHIIEFTPVWRLTEWVRGLGSI